MNGYYDDDGNKLNPELVPKPGLCLPCRPDDNPSEEILCALNRLDQRNDDFKCFAYQLKNGF